MLLDFVCEYDRPLYVLYIFVRHMCNLIFNCPKQSFCDYSSCESVANRSRLKWLTIR